MTKRMRANLPPVRIGLKGLEGNVARFVSAVRTGAPFHITSRGKVVAVVQPPEPPPHRFRRRPGALQGKIRMAEDFDSLPDDILQSIESWRH